MHANVLMVFCLIRACSAKTFDLSNSGITYFPNSVSWVVSYMKLDHNLIRHVDYIKPYPYLAIFNLHDNLLTQFPNFTNITDTLTEIYLGKNWIRYIPSQLMDILTNLTILEMSNNQLTIIPDVPGPAHTLYRLDLASNDFSDFPALSRLGRRLEDMNLANNSITEVRLGHLEQLPSLKSLDLSLNKLSSFPNLCLYAGNSVDVSLSSNPLICDRKMAYVKLAENQGILNRTDELTCVQPPHLQNTAWTDIAVSDLYDHFSDNRIELLSCHITDIANMRCTLLTVITELQTPSMVRCAMMCLSQPNCLVYAFLADTSTCTLIGADHNSDEVDGLEHLNRMFMFC
ncbi:hypothetical protein LSH36_1156g00050 [Paralvinella palmiformis]|uniref:Apple domain-containing protein n=1 Tax=Paralvinella palmiformis TaxID=53620 RepID=A0AAD9IVK4_9ANNE|nr:hypothetical protein LSH36_1156g00050 [Paralvinella palmiformis]